MEKFTIKVTDSGVVVIGEKGNRLEFSAGEALMLLDILKNEEVELRKIAEAASPLPVNINVWAGIRANREELFSQKEDPKAHNRRDTQGQSF